MTSRGFHPGGWRKRLTGIALATCIVLAGCTPEYNWREVVVADGHVQAVFPARVDSETRTLLLAGQTLPFTLAVAQVNQTMFAVGSAPLPSALGLDRAAREKLGQALMRSLYTNVGAAVPTPLPSLGEDVAVTGRVGQRTAWVRGRVWVTDSMVVEAVVSGPGDEASEEEVTRFLRGVQVKGLAGQ
ncbi:hypothetical protein [Bordetella sp. 02P26C-1]|uniref:hypothetical protein n=1 Tax=Bordetella sp. 02P26C-1 TaxID=2683195 RepID=UPI001352EE93|nr:hypothetical protein [Bordetella sp. 02P26C-1]MVW78601.1 hypothetical protein [Bordetella sp. 02P26C-1]